MTDQSNTSEHSLDDYNALFDEINSAIKTVEGLTDSESNYDKMTLYYSTICLIHSQAEYMAGVGFEESRTNELMKSLYTKVNAITSTLSYVNNLKDEINENYDSYMTNIHSKYNEVNKRRAGDL